MNDYSLALDRLRDQLDRDLSWRLRELTPLNATLANSDFSDQERMLILMGYMIVYAHWEGFVRNASQRYVEFVLTQVTSYQAVTLNFIALAYEHQFAQASFPTSFEKQLALIRDILFTTSRPDIQGLDKRLSARSNLNEYCLRLICTKLGVNPHELLRDEKLIIEQLLAPRNRIAHGSRSNQEENGEEAVAKLRKIRSHVLDLLNKFYEIILQAAANRLYLRNSPAPT